MPRTYRKTVEFRAATAVRDDVGVHWALTMQLYPNDAHWLTLEAGDELVVEDHGALLRFSPSNSMVMPPWWCVALCGKTILFGQGPTVFSELRSATPPLTCLVCLDSISEALLALRRDLVQAYHEWCNAKPVAPTQNGPYR